MIELRKIKKLLLVLLISLNPITGQATSVTVENLRMWRAPDHTRLVFDLSGSIKYRLFTLSQPHRAVLDMSNVQLKNKLPVFDLNGPMLSGIRTGKQGQDGLRVVLDMKMASKPRAYLLKPYGQYGYRLVVDLHQAASAIPVKQKPPKPTVYTTPKSRTGPVIIAIDAGHGGEDPGAIGRRYRTREKVVVLAIAKELKRLIDRDRSLRAVMTRRGDYFVSLKKRRDLAEDVKAEMFISIHADSLLRSRAKGASVYALSQKGASSAQAGILASGNNKSDLIGGVDLKRTDDVLRRVVVDLAQTGAISSSMDLGKDLLTDLGRAGPVHIKKVGLAGFAVLKSHKFPSVLVETTFISHPGEERKLRSRAYQKKMAKAIYNGIKRFVRRGTLPHRSSRRTVARSTDKKIHIVRRGDTLSDLARTYRVNVAALKFANKLRGSKLIIGKRLVIPN